MKNIITVAKKEFARFFGDKRMVLNTIILPALLIYVMYSFMGSALSNMFTVSDDYVPTATVINLPDSIAPIVQSAGFEITAADAGEIDALKQDISEKQCALLAVFPEDFDAAVAGGSTGDVPQVSLYYNSTDTDSAAAYDAFSALLDNYETSLSNLFDVNAGADSYDVATAQDTSGSIFASMLPMLLMIFLFSGCMSIAPESIAGEKERGTIATLLVTPIKRSELAIGKIIALAVIALLSGASSTLGTLLSLPKLMGSAAEGMSAAFYTAGDYFLLACVILSTVLMLISLISIISAFAKDVKEATTYVSPLMILSMLVAVSTMFGGGASTNRLAYLIPVYNSVQSMSAIFSFAIVPVNLVLTIVSNVFYAALGAFLLTKMFNSETIMFKR